MPEIDRRVTLRLAVVGAALAAVPIGVRRLTVRPPTQPVALRFDEVYRGRRVVGTQLAGPATGPRHDRPQVYIDGRELHVMTLDDGSYTSVLNHYQSFPDLLGAARAAVDNLGGGNLLPCPR